MFALPILLSNLVMEFRVVFSLCFHELGSFVFQAEVYSLELFSRCFSSKASLIVIVSTNAKLILYF